MIVQLPFEQHHFDLIEPDPLFHGVKDRMNLKPLIEQGAATAWVDTEAGEVLTLAGYVVRKPFVRWLWFLPSARGSRMLLRMARHFKAWAGAQYPGTRIEADVVAEFEAGCRFAEFIGLERETDEPMRLADGVNDYHRFAMIVPGERRETDHFNLVPIIGSGRRRAQRETILC